MSMLDDNSEYMKKLLDHIKTIASPGFAPTSVNVYDTAPPNWTSHASQLPPWFFNFSVSDSIIGITPEGQLFMRLAKHVMPLMQSGGNLSYYSATMFNVGRWGCVRAFKCTNADTNEEAFVVVSIVDGKPVLMYDDKNLFPSDGLIAGILLFNEPKFPTISDATGTREPVGTYGYPLPRR